MKCIVRDMRECVSNCVLKASNLMNVVTELQNKIQLADLTIGVMIQMRVQAKCKQLVVSEDDGITTFIKMFYGKVDGQKLSAKSAIARL